MFPQMNQKRVEMSFFGLRPVFDKERFPQIKQQVIQSSLARLPKVLRVSGGSLFNQVFFNFLVQLSFLSRMAAADDFGEVAEFDVRVDFR